MKPVHTTSAVSKQAPIDVGFYDNNWPSQYIGEYYDDQPDVESAQDIELIAGETRNDINAQLATTGHITGIVTDAAGPLQGIEVQVDRYHEDIEMGGGWWDYSGNIQTDENGAYDIGGLETGTYRVRFSDNNSPSQYISEYYNDQTDPQNAETIELNAGQTRSGINALLATAAHITGSVTDDSGPLQGIEVQAYRYEDDGTGYSQWNQISGAQTDETGAYDIGGLQAGTYHVGFYDNNWPSQYISEYYDDQPDVESAQDIELIAGQTRSDINAQLATTGHITGIVTDAAARCRASKFKSTATMRTSKWAVAGGITPGTSRPMKTAPMTSAVSKQGPTVSASLTTTRPVNTSANTTTTRPIRRTARDH